MTNQDNTLKVPVKLIGIHGHAGVGKDTAATYLLHTYRNIHIEHFADALKEACAVLFGIPTGMFFYSNHKEKRASPWNVSPREICQFVATELIRNNIEKLLPNIGAKFFVARLAYELNNLLEWDKRNYDVNDTVIIPDVRFQNEYDWIVSQGGIIIHLTRPGYYGKVGIDSHESEAGIVFTSPDYTVHVENSGTVEELYHKLDKIYRNFYALRFGVNAESAELSDKTDSIV